MRKLKKKKTMSQLKRRKCNNEEDEFNVSLAKMEEEIKPKIINILDSLNKNYLKLQKYQVEKLECLLASKELSISKNKISKKIRRFWSTILKLFAPHVVELVQAHYKENKNCFSRGFLMRLAIDNKIPKKIFEVLCW